jgi:subtilase family serine protease
MWGTPRRPTIRTPLRALALGALGATCLTGAGSAWATAGAGRGGPYAHAARVGSAPGGQQLNLVLPLKANDAGLSAFARSVSTPGSPAYGQYLSYPELAGRFGAPSSARARVVDYLTSHGATAVKVDPTGMFVFATLRVSQAERVFSTSLARFSTGHAGFVAPTAQVAVPAPLRGLIDGVVGLDTRPVVSTPGGLSRHVQPSSAYSPASGTPSGCTAGVQSGGFTPNEYLTAYGVDPLHASGLQGQHERVALIEIDGFRYSDIKTFAQCFGLDVPGITTYSASPGVTKALPPGGEATLDLEVLDAITPDLGQLEVFESTADTGSILRAYLAPLLYPDAKPQIISTSVGLCEKFTFQADNGASIRSAERGYELLAATGITVLAAAGDDGSADCISGEEQNPPASDQTLAVDYPASSPFVTSVGGTQLFLDGGNHIQQQLVWNDTDQEPGIGGGGGLSQLFTRPAYQNGVVSPNQRGVPDISALADASPGYAIYCTASSPCDPSQPWTTVGGTSAATPLMAGAVALINQDLHRTGHQFLGFMNPLLYDIGQHLPSLYSDVTQYGNDVGPWINGGSGQPLGCCTAGPGYDLASGWGTPIVSALDTLALQILPKVANVSLSIPAGQHPVRSHRVIALMRCSTNCLGGAFVIVRIQGQSTFEATSKTLNLAANRRARIVMPFTRNQEARLRAALARGKSIFGEAFGILTDGNTVLKTTAGRRVRISS